MFRGHEPASAEAGGAHDLACAAAGRAGLPSDLPATPAHAARQVSRALAIKALLLFPFREVVDLHDEESGEDSHCAPDEGSDDGVLMAGETEEEDAMAKGVSGCRKREREREREREEGMGDSPPAPAAGAARCFR